MSLLCQPLGGRWLHLSRNPSSQNASAELIFSSTRPASVTLSSGGRNPQAISAELIIARRLAAVVTGSCFGTEGLLFSVGGRREEPGRPSTRRARLLPGPPGASQVARVPASGWALPGPGSELRWARRFGAGVVGAGVGAGVWRCGGGGSGGHGGRAGGRRGGCGGRRAGCPTRVVSTLMLLTSTAAAAKRGRKRIACHLGAAPQSGKEPGGLAGCVRIRRCS